MMKRTLNSRMENSFSEDRMDPENLLRHRVLSRLYWMETVHRAAWILLAPVTAGWNIIFWEKRARRSLPAICFWNFGKRIPENIVP